MGTRKKGAAELVFNLQWRYKPDSGGDKLNVIGMYDTELTTANFEMFKSYLLKNSGVAGNDVKVTYLTDDGQEWVIDSQTCFEIALNAFRLKARLGEVIFLKLDKTANLGQTIRKHSNDVETQSDVDSMGSNTPAVPPAWFVDYMTQFKREVVEEVTTNVTTNAKQFDKEKERIPAIPIMIAASKKHKPDISKRSRKHIVLGETTFDKEVSRSFKYERKLENKLDKLDAKTKKIKEKKQALINRLESDERSFDSSPPIPTKNYEDGSTSAFNRPANPANATDIRTILVNPEHNEMKPLSRNPPNAGEAADSRTFVHNIDETKPFLKNPPNVGPSTNNRPANPATAPNIRTILVPEHNVMKPVPRNLPNVGEAADSRMFVHNIDEKKPPNVGAATNGNNRPANPINSTNICTILVPERKKPLPRHLPNVGEVMIERKPFLNATCHDNNRCERLMGGDVFIRRWSVLNNGTQRWSRNTELRLTWGSSELVPTMKAVAVPPLMPGGTTIISLCFRVPKKPGTYETYWNFYDANIRFGNSLSCCVIVEESLGAVSPFEIQPKTLQDEYPLYKLFNEPNDTKKPMEKSESNITRPEFGHVIHHQPEKVVNILKLRMDKERELKQKMDRERELNIWRRDELAEDTAETAYRAECFMRKAKAMKSKLFHGNGSFSKKKPVKPIDIFSLSSDEDCGPSLLRKAEREPYPKKERIREYCGGGYGHPARYYDNSYLGPQPPLFPTGGNCFSDTEYESLDPNSMAAHALQNKYPFVDVLGCLGKPVERSPQQENKTSLLAVYKNVEKTETADTVMDLSRKMEDVSITEPANIETNPVSQNMPSTQEVGEKYPSNKYGINAKDLIVDLSMNGKEANTESRKLGGKDGDSSMSARDVVKTESRTSFDDVVDGVFMCRKDVVKTHDDPLPFMPRKEVVKTLSLKIFDTDTDDDDDDDDDDEEAKDEKEENANANGNEDNNNNNGTSDNNNSGESFCEVDSEASSVSSGYDVLQIPVCEEKEDGSGYVYITVDGNKLPVPRHILRPDFLVNAEEAPAPLSTDDERSLEPQSTEEALADARREPAPLQQCGCKGRCSCGQQETREQESLKQEEPFELEESFEQEEEEESFEDCGYLGEGACEHQETKAEASPEEQYHCEHGYSARNEPREEESPEKTVDTNRAVPGNSMPDQTNGRLFIFPSTHPGYEAVFNGSLSLDDNKEESEPAHSYSWTKSPTQYSLCDVSENRLYQRADPYGPLDHTERSPPRTPEQQQSLFVSMSPPPACPYGVYYPPASYYPSQQSSQSSCCAAHCGYPAHFVPNYQQSTPKSESRPKGEGTPSAPPEPPKADENVFGHGIPMMLPENFVNGAVNVASSAINTARSVLQNMMTPPKKEPGRWVNGHWVTDDQDSCRAKNLLALADMGFLNADLNATLLARYNDNLQKVVMELVELTS